MWNRSLLLQVNERIRILYHEELHLSEKARLSQYFLYCGSFRGCLVAEIVCLTEFWMKVSWEFLVFLAFSVFLVYLVSWGSEAESLVATVSLQFVLWSDGASFSLVCPIKLFGRGWYGSLPGRFYRNNQQFCPHF